MPKARAATNPLSAVLRAGRKALEVSAVLPDGSDASFTLHMPSSSVRASLLESVAEGAQEDAAAMLSLCERAVRASLDGADELSDDDVSDLVAMTGGIQGDLAQGALRLCGFSRGQRRREQSPLPTGSRRRSAVA